MNEDYMTVKEAAKEYCLFLKIATSVKSFDSYNSFFNIYDEFEEACRRVVVLTKNEKLEEVYDENPTEPINEGRIVDGILWVKDYSLLINPEKIDLDDLKVSRNLVEQL
ncbi:hypothetical protein [Clostridium saccharobutylicum]|uniref:Uncharacterized protein n=1 Tax=Clostridium saccharobutylicum TaxID=169679 RepID=A0A1S8MYP5_CLOSA|nr:hypothetical protein [Clostridium saccharobutylicum]OOM09307.1 hypothetical protein CLOSAC_35880 [Clostridium saccharobutylicum]